MPQWATDATELIGNTPLVRLNAVVPPGATVFAKLEAFQPGFSVKDRIAVSMIRDAERQGVLQPGATIVEPTSGNTGIGLAWVAAAKGYRCILVMPESVSQERRMVLRRLGAQVVLTPAAQRMPGAIAKAAEVAAATPNSWIPQQFENPANPKIHRETTAEEIWRDTEGRVDVVISGVGTGGTLDRRRRSAEAAQAQPCAWSPSSRPPPPCSPAASLAPPRSRASAPASSPTCSIRSLIDEIVRVTDDDAIIMARRLAAEEGLLTGISSGAAAWAAAQVAGRAESAGKVIVAIFPSAGERYLSTALYDDIRE